MDLDPGRVKVRRLAKGVVRSVHDMLSRENLGTHDGVLNERVERSEDLVLSDHEIDLGAKTMIHRGVSVGLDDASGGITYALKIWLSSVAMSGDEEVTKTMSI